INSHNLRYTRQPQYDLKAGWEETIREMRGKQVLSAGAAGQGRVIKRVTIPPRKEGHPPGSKSLEAVW
ncbi:MAG: hypothetical protein L6300_15740, partial [Syntrophaceae bacterium]|nr:hypothetical protein [Syntrophaceae bacterium]